MGFDDVDIRWRDAEQAPAEEEKEKGDGKKVRKNNVIFLFHGDSVSLNSCAFGCLQRRMRKRIVRDTITTFEQIIIMKSIKWPFYSDTSSLVMNRNSAHCTLSLFFAFFVSPIRLLALIQLVSIVTWHIMLHGTSN